MNDYVDEWYKQPQSKENNEDVCFICKHTSYITKCKGCLYNTLKKSNLHSDNKQNDNKKL